MTTNDTNTTTALPKPPARLRPLHYSQDYTRADAATLGALNDFRKADSNTVAKLEALLAKARQLADQSAAMAANCDKGYAPGNNEATTVGMRRRELRSEMALAAELAQPQPTTGVLEAALRDAVAECPGLRFGYIGNLERWGDDRSLRIWVVTPEGHTGAELWQGVPHELTFGEVCRVRALVKAFGMGRAAK